MPYYAIAQVPEPLPDRLRQTISSSMISRSIMIIISSSSRSMYVYIYIYML